MNDGLRNKNGAANLDKSVMFQNFSTPVGEVVEVTRSQGGEFIFMQDPLLTGSPDVTPIANVVALKKHFERNRGMWANGFVYDLRNAEPQIRSGSNTRLEVLGR